jgi:curved DNA-binding protein
VARDYYQVLGIPKDASPEQVQQAYRRLARRHHPDVSKDPESEERFKEINEAYQVLKDPESRRRYNRFGPDFRRVPEGYDETVGAGFGRGPRAPRARGGARTSGAPFGGEWDFHDAGIDIDDLLGGIFGARGPAGPIHGADQETELNLTVEEAYRGGRRTLTLAGPDGPRDLEVNIPPGVREGQRIRLAGQGGRGRGDAEPGDLYLVVRIAPHPRYRVQGRDLIVDLPVAPWEAALGATVSIDTPGGPGTLRVPAGSSTGRRLRLRGRGMPNATGTPGDLYAEIKVMVPPAPGDRERKLFEELSQVSRFDARRNSR